MKKILVQTKKVAWKPTFPNRGVSAEAAHAVIESIETTRGAASPEALVEHAQDTNSPIHPLFTWDDQEAATKWRLEEAQEILRSLVVEVTVPDVEPMQVRAFHRVGVGLYASLDTVQAQSSYRDRVIEDAINDLEAARRRADHLAIVLGERTLRPAIEGLDKTLRLLKHEEDDQ